MGCTACKLQVYTIVPTRFCQSTDDLSRINWPAISSEIVSQLLDVHLDKGNPVECFCYSQQGVPDSLVQEVMLQDYINWSEKCTVSSRPDLQ